MSDVDLARVGRITTGWVTALAILGGGALWLGALYENDKHQDREIRKLERDHARDIQKLEARVERLERLVFQFPPNP